MLLRWYALWLALPLLASAQNLPDLHAVQRPQQIRPHFVYWGADLLVCARDTMAGKPVLRFFHSPLAPTNETIENYDHDVLDSATLQPLAKYHPLGNLFYSYLPGNRVRLTMVCGKDTTRQELRVPGPIHSFRGPGVNSVLLAAPLKLGFRAKFHELTVNFPYPGNDPVTVTPYWVQVIGKETITVAGRSAETYVVEVMPETPGKGVYYKSWVLTTSPHIAIRFIYTSYRVDGSHLQRKPYAVRDYFIPQ